MNIPRFLIVGFAALVWGASAPTTAAPVLLGNSTLNNANDLTVVQDGTINYEFLDLTTTYGLTVASSLSLYGGQGFHWAAGADVAVLFGAFNIAYGHFPGGGFYIPTSLNPLVSVNGVDALNLASYLGHAPGLDAVLGWLDEDTAAGARTYACIGSACTPKVFLQSNPSFWPKVSVIGTFLVRSYDTTPPTTTVPVPGALPLLGSGLLAFGGLRRRTRAL